MVLATFTDALVAYGTVGLALFTIALAMSTRRLARVATRDQRTQWRPVLMAGEAEVDEGEEGVLRIHLDNVGRGPALGIYGQLRFSGRVGSSVLGIPVTVLPGATVEMRFPIPESFVRSEPFEFRVSYYDIGEWMHVTEMHSKLRLTSALEASRNVFPLQIGKTFLTERDRQLVALYGSPRGREIGKRNKKLHFRLWYWLKYRVRGHL